MTKKIIWRPNYVQLVSNRSQDFFSIFQSFEPCCQGLSQRFEEKIHDIEHTLMCFGDEQTMRRFGFFHLRLKETNGVAIITHCAAERGDLFELMNTNTFIDTSVFCWAPFLYYFFVQSSFCQGRFIHYHLLNGELLMNISKFLSTCMTN